MVTDTGGTGGSITFEDRYRGEHGRLLGLLTVVAGDRETAHEATAQAFTRALERWDRVPVMASPSGSAYRVGVNVVKRRIRRATVEKLLLAPRWPTERRRPSHLNCGMPSARCRYASGRRSPSATYAI